MSKFSPPFRIPSAPGRAALFLRTLVPRDPELLFSPWHPASLLLNSRGIAFLSGRWEGLPFLLASASGTHWLPLPPPWFGEDPDRQQTFLREAAPWLFSLNQNLPSRIDNLPLGMLFSPDHPSPPVPQDRDRILLRENVLRPTGHRYRSLRWEVNRLLKQDPSPRIEPWPAGSDRLALLNHPGIRDVANRFFLLRREKARSEMELLMAEDMEAIHHNAVSIAPDLGLTGFVLWVRDHPAAWQWIVFSESGQAGICLLECRDPEIPGASIMLTRRLFEALPALRQLNIGGDSGISSLAVAKDLDHPGLVVPTYSRELVAD